MSEDDADWPDGVCVSGAFGPGSAWTDAVVHFRRPPDPITPHTGAVVHFRSPPDPISPHTGAVVHFRRPPDPLSPWTDAVVHFRRPPDPISPWTGAVVHFRSPPDPIHPHTDAVVHFRRPRDPIRPRIDAVVHFRSPRDPIRPRIDADVSPNEAVSRPAGLLWPPRATIDALSRGRRLDALVGGSPQVIESAGVNSGQFVPTRESTSRRVPCCDLSAWGRD